MREPTLTTPGQQISYTTPDGRVTITVQYVHPGAYTVTTYQGTLRIEDQCDSYPTEDEARAVARAYAVLAKAEALAAPVASLAALAGQGEQRQVAPTMAGAHLADVTDPQHRALATAATIGRVMRGRGGESVTTLKALARKGLVRLVMRPGKRYDVDHAVILPAGERELARLDQVAEEARRLAARLAA